MRKETTMKGIPTLLSDLDRIYHECSLDTYEQTLQEVEQQVNQMLPGFTIAYAEIATVGSERYLHAGMRHVLLPCFSFSPNNVQ